MPPRELSNSLLDNHGVRPGLPPLPDQNVLNDEVTGVAAAHEVFNRSFGATAKFDHFRDATKMILRQTTNRWRLFHQAQQREVTVSGDRAADDGALVRHWAVQGHGIAYKSRLDVAGDLESGRLVDLFPDARGEPAPLYVAYPSRRYQPARIKVLLGYLEGVFG